ncbi:GIY-YIG nuclease family protein [Marinobacterium jannaschii]|uniref:GIY-YIG nuclease family protein n=1 Tax=Marinobacterium jannaschii TaxID=64970 RepID=UPI00056C7E97|nr:GIY-YIG nuclease family protein [Marinobacterium jannaschii]
MNQWYVYMLRCADGTLYTGVSTDPCRRLREHNGEIKGGARYTRARRPVALVWQEPQPDRSAACRREVAVKALRRTDKLRLVTLFSQTAEAVGSQ